MGGASARRAAEGGGRAVVVAALLVALFALHQDGWLWNEPRLVLGLPAGLAYHVGYCLAAALALALAVRWAWPRQLAQDERADPEEGA